MAFSSSASVTSGRLASGFIIRPHTPNAASSSPSPGVFDTCGVDRSTGAPRGVFDTSGTYARTMNDVDGAAASPTYSREVSVKACCF